MLAAITNQSSKERSTRLAVGLVPTQFLWQTKNGGASPIAGHHFNRAIDIYSNNNEFQMKAENYIARESRMVRVNCPASELLEPAFLDFLRSDSVVGLWWGRQLDTEDTICIYESKLDLHLCKESYQMFGIDGRETKNQNGKYQVLIDLKENNFVPGMKFYERVKGRLQERFPYSMDFLFAFPRTYDLSNLLANATDVKITDLLHTSETFNEIIMPSMDFEDVNQDLCLVKEGLNPHVMEVYEFFGLLRLGATEGLSTTNKVDPYVSSYFPAEKATSSSVHKLSCEGLINSHVIRGLVDLAQAFMKTAEKTWVFIHVEGLGDATVSFNNNLHAYDENGHHGYSVLLAGSSIETCMCWYYVNRNDTFLR